MLLVGARGSALHLRVNGQAERGILTLPDRRRETAKSLVTLCAGTFGDERRQTNQAPSVKSWLLRCARDWGGDTPADPFGPAPGGCGERLGACVLGENATSER